MFLPQLELPSGVLKNMTGKPPIKSMDPWLFHGNSWSTTMVDCPTCHVWKSHVWALQKKPAEVLPLASWNGNATHKTLSRKNRGFKTWRQHHNFRTHTITLNFDELERCQTINHQDRANNHGFQLETSSDRARCTKTAQHVGCFHFYGSSSHHEVPAMLVHGGPIDLV